ncbi:MAG: HAD-IIB family hydrolase [Granulosicoccus sp.]
MRWLCTDLDRTLLPNGTANESPQVRNWLAALVQQAPLKLAYVTGRDLGRVEEAIESWSLPLPDVIVADVGTSIYQRTADGWVSNDSWQQQIAIDWQGKTSADVAVALDGFSSLESQAPDQLGRYKMSYNLASTVDYPSIKSDIEKQLADAGLHSMLLYSDDPAAGHALLDVVPAHSDKYFALKFLQTLSAHDSEYQGDVAMVFAGDSGNDLNVLQSDIHSIIVANADATTQDQACRLSKANGTTDRLFPGPGGWPAAQALFQERLNGNYAAGILQGVLHWWPDLVPLLDTIMRQAEPAAQR